MSIWDYTYYARVYVSVVKCATDKRHTDRTRYVIIISVLWHKKKHNAPEKKSTAADDKREKNASGKWFLVFITRLFGLRIK